MVEQKQKTYTKTTPGGNEITVTELTREDIEQELAEFEAKYGMSSVEFAGKWNRGEMDCTHDFLNWAMNCKYMARAHGVKELSIPSRGVGEEWKI